MKNKIKKIIAGFGILSILGGGIGLGTKIINSPQKTDPPIGFNKSVDKTDPPIGFFKVNKTDPPIGFKVNHTDPPIG